MQEKPPGPVVESTDDITLLFEARLQSLFRPMRLSTGFLRLDLHGRAKDIRKAGAKAFLVRYRRKVTKRFCDAPGERF